MIFVADSLPDEALSDFDLAIIGAGAVGVAIATRLAGRVGRIALVEAGGDRFERRLQAQFFREDHLADARHLSTELGRRRMLGGTTSVWGGRCIPLDSEDFEGSVTGTRWPISQADVAPWTASALQFLQAGNDDFSTAALPPSTKSTEVDGIEDPDLKLDRIERFSEPTNVWSKWGQPLVKSKDVVVLQGASCTNIRTTSDARQVIGIDLRTQSGRRLQLNASTVVLACGGLETPRLLLASRDHRSCGLGNEHDLVGRYYMTHFAGSAGTLKLRVPGSDRCFDYARTADGVYARRLILLSAEARRAPQARKHCIPPEHPSDRRPFAWRLRFSPRWSLRRDLSARSTRTGSWLGRPSGDRHRQSFCGTASTSPRASPDSPGSDLTGCAGERLRRESCPQFSCGGPTPPIRLPSTQNNRPSSLHEFLLERPPIPLACRASRSAGR